jgi:hypothetical protein
VADKVLQQRKVALGAGLSVLFPAQGYLYDVLKQNSQQYVRDIKKTLLPE